MTRARDRLLGPCFKTGQTGGRLSHRDTHSSHSRRRRPEPKAQSQATGTSGPNQTPAGRSYAEREPQTGTIPLIYPVDWAGLPESENPGPTPRTVGTQRHSSRHIPVASALMTEHHCQSSREVCIQRRIPSHQLNATEFRQLCLFPSQRFHALLNSLFKVLCNFPSRYLFAIGLVVIFSLR